MTENILSSDYRNEALYSQTEASRYLNISNSTLRYWAIGESRASRTVTPLIKIPEGSKRLSFLNLVELHVLNSFRTVEKINLPKIRTALEFVREKLGVKRPLLDANFETNGVDLFITRYSQLINVSKDGQQAMRCVLKDSLKRVSRDAHKIPFKLFPFTHTKWEESPKVISMTPRIYSGRPVIDGTRLSTAFIAERYKAGDSIVALAEDYMQSVEIIEEAIRCELPLAA